MYMKIKAVDESSIMVDITDFERAMTEVYLSAQVHFVMLFRSFRHLAKKMLVKWLQFSAMAFAITALLTKVQRILVIFCNASLRFMEYSAASCQPNKDICAHSIDDRSSGGQLFVQI